MNSTPKSQEKARSFRPGLLISDLSSVLFAHRGNRGCAAAAAFQRIRCRFANRLGDAVKDAAHFAFFWDIDAESLSVFVPRIGRAEIAHRGHIGRIVEGPLLRGAIIARER